MVDAKKLAKIHEWLQGEYLMNEPNSRSSVIVHSPESADEETPAALVRIPRKALIQRIQEIGLGPVETITELKKRKLIADLELFVSEERSLPFYQILPGVLDPFDGPRKSIQHYIDPETGERRSFNVVSHALSANKPTGRHGLSLEEERALIEYIKHEIQGDKQPLNVHVLKWVFIFGTTPLRNLPIGSEDFRETIGDWIPPETLHRLAKLAGVSRMESLSLSIPSLLLMARDQARKGILVERESNQLLRMSQICEITQVSDRPIRECMKTAGIERVDPGRRDHGYTQAVCTQIAKAMMIHGKSDSTRHGGKRLEDHIKSGEIPAKNRQTGK